MKIDIPDIIQQLPLSVIQKMKLERGYIVASKNVNKILRKDLKNNSQYYPLVRNNRFYGNEALLKQYACVDDYLYAIIEHGLYFGNNHQKVGLKHEWELGCILTYGKYRKKLIEEYFPSYYCEMIGPMIHYADVNYEFQEQLSKKMDLNERTLLFFPVHGNEHFSPIYDTNLTVNKIIDIANKKDCKNIIICVYLGDMDLFLKVVHENGLEERVQITSCGNRYSKDFLCNQKAMISLADITISNSLGTHIGYCIYMKKPHILLPQDFSYQGDEKVIREDFGGSNRSENWKNDFVRETHQFQEHFSERIEEITDEQYKLCDYYWGFSQVKSPSELRQIYLKCKSYTKQFVLKP